MCNEIFKIEEEMTEKIKPEQSKNWKIQDICYIMGTEIFKIEEEMTEKIKF